MTKQKARRNEATPLEEESVQIRVNKVLEQHDCDVDSLMSQIFGCLPSYLPEPHVDRARRIVQILLLFSIDEDILLQAIEAAECNGDVFLSAHVSDSEAITESFRKSLQPAVFSFLVHEVAHMRYALSLDDPVSALGVLGGRQAEHGQKFLQAKGRVVGVADAVNLDIESWLDRDQAMTAKAIWREICDMPPDDWYVAEDRNKEQILVGPAEKRVSRRTFENRVSKIRKSRKSRFIEQ
jgi:hypothetical protein